MSKKLDGFDIVLNPEHYASGDIECIDAMRSAFGDDEVKAFCKLNAFKYLWRSEKKGSEIVDMKKARWYIDKWVEVSLSCKDASLYITKPNIISEKFLTETAQRNSSFNFTDGGE